MDPSAKTYILGLALMNVVGEGVLSTAVDSLGAQIRGAVATLSIESISRLPQLDFRRDGAILASACVTLSGQDGDGIRVEVSKRVGEFGKLDITNEDKTLLLATYLANRFGPLVFGRALAFAGRAPDPKSANLPAQGTVVPMRPGGGDAPGPSAASQPA
jgi:hypothetical protein